MAVPSHVLIVEDDPGIAEMIEMMLTADACTTETVTDGNAAVDRLTGPPPDLVVLDVMLPNTDGLNILRTLRANENWTKVPVIVATVRGSDDNTRHPAAPDRLRRLLAALGYPPLMVTASSDGPEPSDIWRCSRDARSSPISDVRARLEVP